jgi:ATP-dependent DNA helicase RecG
MDRIFERCVRESKPLPDFTGTDDYQVCLALRGDVQHPEFLPFLERVAKETAASFTTADLLVISAVYQDELIPAHLKSRVKGLRDLGIIEPRERRKGRYLLSRRFYAFLGRKGAYTRQKGLDRERNKALLLREIEASSKDGSRLGDLLQVLPDHSRPQVQVLLRELRAEGKIHNVGPTRASRWFPRPPEHGIAASAERKDEGEAP